jgi:undecaprenyl-diphosphatase
VLHVGTAAALLVYFWREWLRLFMAVLGRGKTKERNLIALLILGTLPAVFFGFVFEKWFRHLFGSAFAAACFLVVNGVVLFAGERLRRRAAAASDRRGLAQAGWGDALLVGLFQASALGSALNIGRRWLAALCQPLRQLRLRSRRGRIGDRAH